jgi:hypothetical protein
MKNVSPSSQQIRAMANLLLIPGNADFVASQHNLSTGQRTQTTQVLIAKPKECSSFVVMRQFYNGVSHGWLKEGNRERKASLVQRRCRRLHAAVQAGRFFFSEPNTEENVFPATHPEKEMFAKQIDDQPKQAPRLEKSYLASGMRKLPGLRIKAVATA